MEKESAKHVTALTGICMSDIESCYEELTYEEQAISYKELYTISEEVCKILEKQKKTIGQLHDEMSDHLAKIYELSNEVIQLTSNLISIIQLCDQGMVVNFNKSDCLVTDKKGEVLMRHIRSKENCYLWVPQEEGKIGKQTRMLHPRLGHQVNSKALEPLHMDWMEQMLKESDVEQDIGTLYCDKLNAFNTSKNTIQLSRTNHIDICHHFIRDFVEENIVTIEHGVTKEQLVDNYTKALDTEQFEKLRGNLGICVQEKL